MRVTNNMIMDNAASNINGTKELVNKRNTQMTTQKKISKPSDDPVVAVRSLRLSTTLSQVDQYYEKNIPDATSWMEITETALINMRSITSDCRTLAVTGSTDTYSETDRQTLMNQIESLQKQLYAEGNADYAGRTVFTGFRTNCNLTFTEDEPSTEYTIDQHFTCEDSLEEHRYYSGSVEVPTTEDELDNDISDISENDYYRIRLAYDDTSTMKKFSMAYGDADEEAGTGATTFEFTLDADGNGTATATKDGAAVTGGATYTFKTYDNETDWAEADSTGNNEKVVGDDEIVYIKETGDIIFGKNVSTDLMANDATVDAEYTRTGFESGELRPEYYYNCVKEADLNDTHCPVTYEKYDENGNVLNYDIEYTVSQNQTLTVNTEASNVFDSSLQRDLGEMLNAVQATITAHNKVDEINAMLEESQYSSATDQAKLKEWLAAAEKEASYADDNMQELFSTEIGKIDTYYAKINLAITDLGCKVDSLNLTKTRVGDQQETVEDLQSQNDDVDLSQIIIDYTAAYTAYQSSLTAAGKLSGQTLLNYI